MSKHKGSITEIKFLLLCLENHIGVSHPYGDNNAYDFIIDQRGRLYRIQVKGTYRRESRKGYRLTILSSNQKGSTEVRYKDVDFFALYVHESNAWYIIPCNLIKGTTIDLRPNSKGRMNKWMVRDGVIPDLQTWGT